MSKITKFYNSSVGRKLLMGLSGFFLCSFLVVHLYLNLFLLKQDAGKTFDVYSEFMATYPLIRPLEIVLFLGFLLHAIVGVWLWISNRIARPSRYDVRRPSETSTLTSRTAIWTGGVVLVFLVLHINSFFVQSRFFANGRTLYEIVEAAFRDPWTDAFYLVALAFLAFHLKHGVQSAFQTLGIQHHGRYQGLVDAIGAIFWLLIPIGFAVLPLYFFWAH